jgi:beta-mannosidase
VSIPGGWALLRAPAGSDPAGLRWADAAVATPPIAIGREHDDEDVWLRARVTGPGQVVFPMLGPIADLYVDGELRLATRSLFRTHELYLLEGEHELMIALRSPSRMLGAKRPRPRWKTRLTDHQQLRWLRTPLLGRMPSWSADAAPRGLLRAPRLLRASELDARRVGLHAWLDGDRGRVAVLLPPDMAGDAQLRVGDHTTTIQDRSAVLTLDDPPRWWPHTHGEPARLTAQLRCRGHELALGHVGFRSIAIDDPRRFGLRWNGVPVFCRGAVFVPDPRRDDPEADRRALIALRDAGGNMVRVGGTMRYEDARFFDWCDELGLMVWQDFMFANMDYPVDDDAFSAEVTAEVDEQLARWAAHPSLAVLCGGSEVAQQAAMVGQPPERWYGPLFQTLLPERCHAVLPEIPYVPNSPSSPLEGDGAEAPPPLPFRPDVGVAHYYGVGAYLRPFEDARRAEVAFASECLALANVPEPAAVDALFGDEAPAVHTPTWKRGVPRDHGVGWDFEDVRDHYHALLFGREAMADRYADTEGYLERARITSAEVLLRTYSEWRRAGSSTHGGLVWFLRDLLPGAGWGLLDVDGNAKSPLLALRRAWSPTALLLTDEGNNGLRLHVVHEGPARRALRVEVTLHRLDGTRVAQTERSLEIAGRSALALDVEGMFGAFRDVGYAFRFGPRAHDVLLARLCEGEQQIGEAAHLPPVLPSALPDPGLSAAARRLDDGTLRVRVQAQGLALFVVARVPGWHTDDGYFHLGPGHARELTFRASPGAPPPRGDVHALGAPPARIAEAK